MTALTIGVHHDFRNPEPFRESWSTRYRQILEQIDWIDQQDAFGAVSVSEHHFLDDGYASAPLALCAAIAARTSRVTVSTNILALPLHHPLRVAEDALTIDVLSSGRFRLGVGLGYREPEFAALQTSLRDRRDRMEEGLALLRGAFSGARFAADGTHWPTPPTAVTPPPVRADGPPVWIGGGVPVAIDRAARLGDGFHAVTNEQCSLYRQACERHGKPPGGTCRTTWAVVHEDPERAIAELGPSMVYMVNQYIEFGYLQVPRYEDARQLVADGLTEVVDAAGAVAMLEEAAAAGADELHLFGALPGESLASGTARLQYVADHVIPALGMTLR